jgi:phosphopantothenoylcysteine decarboxylase/phosphopantothenate--cysteine ligase
MAYAIAEVFAEAGAEVVLVSGPVQLQANHPNIQVVPVETAAQMYDACHQDFSSCQIAVLAAAVADYTVAHPADKKIKKQGDNLTLELVPTKDILMSLGQVKSDQQVLIGFALETNDAIANAKKKLRAKNLDFIVLNTLQDEGAGFRHDTNKISIINKYNKIANFELKDKQLVAQDILNYLEEYLREMKEV